jgi:ribosome recycling factor
MSGKTTQRRKKIIKIIQKLMTNEKKTIRQHAKAIFSGVKSGKNKKRKNP